MLTWRKNTKNKVLTYLITVSGSMISNYSNLNWPDRNSTYHRMNPIRSNYKGTLLITVSNSDEGLKEYCVCECVCVSVCVCERVSV
jgi:hypothetical protein